MKRIKYEDIQTSVQNYLKQRNLKSTLIEDSNNEQAPAVTSAVATPSSTKLKSSISPSQLVFKTQMSTKADLNADLNLMALNDLVLIESSINDYYSFSFDSTSDQEYLKQYKTIEDFLQKSTDLNVLKFPLFVYMCIDLVTLGYSIKPILNKFESKNEKFNQVIEELNLFNETKDVAICRLVSNFRDNKYEINLSSKNWNKFMNFLRQSSIHLFIRIINLNLKINVNEELSEQDDEEELMSVNEPFHQVKLEPSDQHVIPNLNEFKYSTSINLNSLNECIERINSQPSRLNGMCSYYLNDYQDCITSVNISPNTEMIAVSTENSSIYLYKLNETKVKTKNNLNYYDLIGGHSSAVFKSKFTHDSKYLLSCGDDNLACLWNVSNSNMLNQAEEEEYEEENDDDEFESKIKSSFEHSSLIQTSLVTSYSGHLYSVWDLDLYSQLNLFCTASKDATARLWSFDRIYPLRIFAGHQSDVNSVKFHPNGAYLATGSSDKTVRLWSVSTGEFVRLFSGHRSRVYCLAFSPDGSYLASAGEDKKIKIYDLRSGLIYKEFKGHADTVHSLLFDNNSEILCSGGLDKTVKFWDFHQKNIKINSELFSDYSATSTTNKAASSPTTSHELISSVFVDFNVYSIYCDMQNVFHVNGAKKVAPPAQEATKLQAETKPDSKLNVKIEEPQAKVVQKAKRVASKLKSVPQKATQKTIPNANSSETRSTISTRSSRRNLSDSQMSASAAPVLNSNATSFLFNNDDDLYEA